MNTGNNWDMEVISMIWENIKPIPTPPRVEAVNYETLFPEISPTLFLFANLTLMLALEAAESKKHIFFPTFAIDASAKKWLGNLRVRISM
jgi:hypothetical protein